MAATAPSRVAPAAAAATASAKSTPKAIGSASATMVGTALTAVLLLRAAAVMPRTTTKVNLNFHNDFKIVFL
jgi:hypothetical protein